MLCLWRPPQQADRNPEPSLGVTCIWSKGKQFVTGSEANKLQWRNLRAEPLRANWKQAQALFHHKESLKHRCSWAASERIESPRELARKKALPPPCYSGFNDHLKIWEQTQGLPSYVQSNFHALVSVPWVGKQRLSCPLYLPTSACALILMPTGYWHSTRTEWRL